MLEYKVRMQNMNCKHVYRYMFCILLCLSMYDTIYAQDIHYSQYMASTVQLNPALCGQYNGTYRISGIYRNQWATVPVNYNTAKISFEAKPFKPGKYGGLGIGVSGYFDRAGDSRYTTFVPTLVVSYLKQWQRTSAIHSVSIGTYMGSIYKRISYNNLEFDAQYNGEFFDSRAPSFEANGNQSNWVVDIGIGAMYRFVKNKKWGFQLGYSLAHINTPQYSFLSNQEVLLNMRHSGHLAVDVSLNNKTRFQLHSLYQRQDVKQEWVVGGTFYHQLASARKNNIVFFYGPMYRYRDAAILLAGIEYNQVQVGFSYDINVSNFRRATVTYGATELSVIYVISPVEKWKSDNKICPIF